MLTDSAETADCARLAAGPLLLGGVTAAFLLLLPAGSSGAADNVASGETDL